MSSRQAATGRLPKKTLKWGLQSILDHGANSLFQTPFEFEVFAEQKEKLTTDLSELRIDFFRWSKPRRMLVPKDQISFRLATQLDPIDAIILMAIVKDSGKQIEARRQPADVVFSHRFAERSEWLYRRTVGWVAFWKEAKSRADDDRFILQTDISDFYSQISHSEILSQLERCEVPDRVRQSVAGFLEAFGGDHGRGVPIGPHSAHLLAELSLIGADSLLANRGYEFLRYIDDYQIFCDSRDQAQAALWDLAELLASEFGLALNRGKTKILSSRELIEQANRIIREAAPKEPGDRILKAIESVTEDEHRYLPINLERVKQKDPEAFTEESITKALSARLRASRVDYPDLGFFLRRLAQVGAPGGIPYVLKNFDNLAPVIGDAAHYLTSAGQHWDKGWKDLGSSILRQAKSPMVKRSPYLQMVLYGLFAREADLNHFPQLSSRFRCLDPAARREVLLAARVSGSTDWLHAIRKRAKSFDPWTRRAFVHASSVLSAKQQEECLKSIDVNEQTADSVVLGALLAERSKVEAGLLREPVGPAWAALHQMVAKSRRRLVRSRMMALEKELEQQVYGQVQKGRLLVATWNLRNFGGGGFGFGERLPEAFMFIARVLLSFDLIAVQEVQSEKSVDEILNLLGHGWKKVVCGEAVGSAGNREMSAFIYRARRVNFPGKVEQVVLPRSRWIQGKHQFARPPFIVNFEAGGSKITACTAHIYFGATRGNKYDRRVAEIKALTKVILERATKAGSTALLLGDLNVVDLQDRTMAPLKRAGLALAEPYLSATNVARDRFYTQIALQATQDGPRLKRAGVFPVFDIVFRLQDEKRYLAEMEASKAWETQKKRAGSVDSSSYYQKWRTYQLSDHLPVWAELSL